MSTYRLPGMDFDAIRKSGKVYLSAKDIAAHLEKAAEAADQIDEEHVAGVLRLYRRTIVESVAALS